MPIAKTTFWLPDHHLVTKGDEIPNGHPCLKGREELFDDINADKPAPVKRAAKKATKSATSK